MRRHPSSIFLALAPLFGIQVAGCNSADGIANADPGRPAAAPTQPGDDPFPPGPYGDRDPALAQQLVDGGALLLDVRSAGEFAGGHLDGAVNIPHTQVDERLAEIREMQGQDPHRPIVLYCRSGHRAGLAKRELETAGFDRVTNLGGLADWPD
jgi:phage shock protein E